MIGVVDAVPRPRAGAALSDPPEPCMGGRLWLFVWATNPPSQCRAELAEHIRGYMRAKRYQLGLRRGAAFIYDE